MGSNTLKLTVLVVIAPVLISCEISSVESRLSEIARSLAIRYLRAMNEPVIEEMPADSYRFILLPPFHHPVAIRASCGPYTCTLVSKQLSGRGSSEPGTLSHESSRALSRSEWRTIARVVEEAGFWNDSRESYSIGLGAEDSVLWIVEGKQTLRQYAWASWWGQGIEHDGLRRISLELLELSDLAKERPDLMEALSVRSDTQ